MRNKTNSSRYWNWSGTSPFRTYNPKLHFSPCLPGSFCVLTFLTCKVPLAPFEPPVEVVLAENLDLAAARERLVKIDKVHASGEAGRRDQEGLGADGVSGATESLTLGFVPGVVDLIFEKGRSGGAKEEKRG